jgi:copper chaperone CopZ
MKETWIRNLGIGIQPADGQWDVAAVRLSIDGMKCDCCARSIEQMLAATPGVISVRVEQREGKGAISFDPVNLDVPGILAAIEGLRACDGRGYQAEAVFSVGVAIDHNPVVPVLGGAVWH